MHTPPVEDRLRSACVLLATVQGHADDIAEWFALADDPDLPMSAAEAAENVRDLMEGYSEALVARSRMLAALDDLTGARSLGATTAIAERELRRSLGALRGRLASGVGLLALEKSDLERPLPREGRALLQRADGCRTALRAFFSEWRPPQPHGWPTEALRQVDAGADALRAAILSAPPPGPATLAQAAATEAFDEAFDDAAELVQAMLQLARQEEAAARVAPAWHSPGMVTDDAAVEAVTRAALGRLLGVTSGAPAEVTPQAQPNRGA